MTYIKCFLLKFPFTELPKVVTFKSILSPQQDGILYLGFGLVENVAGHVPEGLLLLVELGG